MAKTKTVKRGAWGVFSDDGKLERCGITCMVYETFVYREDAIKRCHKHWGETVRPVTISYEVNE